MDKKVSAISDGTNTRKRSEVFAPRAEVSEPLGAVLEASETPGDGVNCFNPSSRIARNLAQPEGQTKRWG
jgi:hypothetical protein